MYIKLLLSKGQKDNLPLCMVTEHTFHTHPRAFHPLCLLLSFQYNYSSHSVTTDDTTVMCRSERYYLWDYTNIISYK